MVMMASARPPHSRSVAVVWLASSRRSAVGLPRPPASTHRLGDGTYLKRWCPGAWRTSSNIEQSRARLGLCLVSEHGWQATFEPCRARDLTFYATIQSGPPTGLRHERGHSRSGSLRPQSRVRHRSLPIGPQRNETRVFEESSPEVERGWMFARLASQRGPSSAMRRYPCRPSLAFRRSVCSRNRSARDATRAASWCRRLRSVHRF